jgi:hypothetical protein
MTKVRSKAEYLYSLTGQDRFSFKPTSRSYTSPISRVEQYSTTGPCSRGTVYLSVRSVPTKPPGSHPANRRTTPKRHFPDTAQTILARKSGLPPRGRNRRRKDRLCKRATKQPEQLPDRSGALLPSGWRAIASRILRPLPSQLPSDDGSAGRSFSRARRKGWSRGRRTIPVVIQFQRNHGSRRVLQNLVKSCRPCRFTQNNIFSASRALHENFAPV